MKTTLLAAAAVLALGIGSAFAGEDLASLQTPSQPATAAQNGIGSFTLSPAELELLTQDTGSQQLPVYASIGVSAANEEAVLTPTSNQGMVQTANSLPSLPDAAQGRVDGLRVASVGR